MANNTHIWRSAACFIQRYGDDAIFQASLEVDRLTQRGDRGGADYWAKICIAIRALQDEYPRGLTH